MIIINGLKNNAYIMSILEKINTYYKLENKEVGSLSPELRDLYIKKTWIRNLISARKLYDTNEYSILLSRAIKFEKDNNI